MQHSCVGLAKVAALFGREDVFDGIDEGLGRRKVGWAEGKARSTAVGADI